MTNTLRLKHIYKHSSFNSRNFVILRFERAFHEGLNIKAGIEKKLDQRRFSLRYDRNKVKCYVETEKRGERERTEDKLNQQTIEQETNNSLQIRKKRRRILRGRLKATNSNRKKK